MSKYSLLSSTTYPDSSDLQTAFDNYVTALNGITDANSPLFKVRDNLIATKRISTLEFNNYNPNKCNFSPDVVTEDDMKKLSDFRALLRIFTESTSLLLALEELHVKLLLTSPLVNKSEYQHIPQDLITQYKKKVYNAYKHASQLVFAIAARPLQQNSMTSPSEKDVKLLGQAITQTTNLLKDPADKTAYREFSAAYSNLPSQSWNIHCKLLVAAGVLVVGAALVMFVFAFPPLLFLLPESLFVPAMLSGFFAAPFIGFAGGGMITTGLSMDLPSKNEFFYHKNSIVSDLQKVRQGSKELISQSALRRNSLLQGMKKVKTELIRAAEDLPQPGQAGFTIS